jgi:hypothetical protein
MQLLRLVKRLHAFGRHVVLVGGIRVVIHDGSG